MSKTLFFSLIVVLPATALAAEATLPERRVDSVSVAQAQSEAPVPETTMQPASTGASVSDWLKLQASGKVASPVIQGQTAAERELVNQRFLDTYEQPIPQMSAQGGSSGSAGGGGGLGQ